MESSYTRNTYIRTIYMDSQETELYIPTTYIHKPLTYSPPSLPSGSGAVALSGGHFPEQAIVKLPPRNVIVLKQIPLSPKENNVCVEVIRPNDILGVYHIHIHMTPSFFGFT